jgi:hypothetical protein
MGKARMTPRTRALLRDALILMGMLVLLSLLAAGHIAATFLFLMPMAFLIFGKRPGKGPAGDENRPGSHSGES